MGSGFRTDIKEKHIILHNRHAVNEFKNFIAFFYDLIHRITAMVTVVFTFQEDRILHF